MADELSIVSKGIADIADKGTEISDVLKLLIARVGKIPVRILLKKPLIITPI